MTNGTVSGRARLAMALTVVAMLCAPAAASAQIRQVSTSIVGRQSTVNFTIGYFALKGLESRVDDDVLLNELQNAQPLLFEIKDFNSAIFGGEYLFGSARTSRRASASATRSAPCQRLCRPDARRTTRRSSRS